MCLLLTLFVGVYLENERWLITQIWRKSYLTEFYIGSKKKIAPIPLMWKQGGKEEEEGEKEKEKEKKAEGIKRGRQIK